MDTALAEKLASEYVRLIDEGWSPDLEEFLGRVPEALREPCRVRIEDLMSIAEEVVQSDAHDEPEDAAESDVLELDLYVDEQGGVSRVTEPEAIHTLAEEALHAAERAAQAATPQSEPEPEPEGPRPLSKEEALAMWDSQVARARSGTNGA